MSATLSHGTRPKKPNIKANAICSLARFVCAYICMYVCTCACVPNNESKCVCSWKKTNIQANVICSLAECMYVCVCVCVYVM